MKNVAAWALIASAASMTANAEPYAPVSAAIKRTIEAHARPGDVVTLTDGKCLYVGQLVRESADQKHLGSTLIQAAGAEGGKWRIAVTRKACGQLSSDVKMHVVLPKPPSLAGGGGIPPLPYGYQAGTRFDLVAD